MKIQNADAEICNECAVTIGDIKALETERGYALFFCDQCLDELRAVLGVSIKKSADTSGMSESLCMAFLDRIPKA